MRRSARRRANAQRFADYSRSVAGVILPPPCGESHVISPSSERLALTYRCGSHGSIPSDASCVRIDDYKAASEMDALPADAGHRRIGFVKGHPNQTASGERLLGFEGRRSERLPNRATPDHRAGFSVSLGARSGRETPALRPRPTAIFASNDDMAAAVCRLHTRGPESVLEFGRYTSSRWPCSGQFDSHGSGPAVCNRHHGSRHVIVAWRRWPLVSAGGQECFSPLRAPAITEKTLLDAGWLGFAAASRSAARTRAGARRSLSGWGDP